MLHAVLFQQGRNRLAGDGPVVQPISATIELGHELLILVFRPGIVVAKFFNDATVERESMAFSRKKDRFDRPMRFNLSFTDIR